MKKIIFVILGCLVVASTAFGSTTTCPTAPGTTYDAYLVPGFTCTSGNLTFSSFGFSQSALNTTAIPATSIGVTPTVVTGNEGFSFNSGWSVSTATGGANTFQDNILTFTATGPMTSLTLMFDGAVTGTGLAHVTENYCINGPLSGCPGGNAGQITVTNPNIPGPPKFNETVFFAPATSVSVSKDITVSSGTAGIATIGVLSNTFAGPTSGVPEPLSFVLLGSGLLGLGLLRKRLHKS